jgi:hypothetical protein
VQPAAPDGAVLGFFEEREMETIRQDVSLFTSGEREAQRQVSLRKAARFTSILGAIYSILFLLSMLIISNEPSVHASDQEVIDYYSNTDHRRLILLAGLYLLPFSAVAFLWFVVLLREWISYSVHRLSRLLSNVQLLSGISFITLSFAAAAATTVTAASVEFSSSSINSSLTREFPFYGHVLLNIFGMRMAAMFIMTSTNIARAAGVLPKWFIYVSFAVAIFLFLVATTSTWVVLVFPIWVLSLSAILYHRARLLPSQLMTAEEFRKRNEERREEFNEPAALE